MSHPFWLDHKHLTRIQHLLSKLRGVECVDDRTVLSGTIHVFGTVALARCSA